MNTTFSVVSPFAGGVRSVVRESLRLPWLPAYAILEFESTLARRVGQRFHFAVVKKSTPMENRSVDVFREQTLGNQFPDLLRRRVIGGMLAFSAQNLLRRADGDQSLTHFVVDDLRVNMFPGKIDTQTRTFRGARDFAPNAVVYAAANDF